MSDYSPPIKADEKCRHTPENAKSTFLFHIVSGRHLYIVENLLMNVKPSTP